MKDLPENQVLDLIFLIDKSGSMYGSEKDTIGGFNSFIQKEKQKDLSTNVTTILFDHEYDVLYKRKSIYEVEELTENEYQVRGSTALLDAIGKTITTLDKEIDNKVLFVIMTDGMENSSIEFSKSQISSTAGNSFSSVQTLTPTAKAGALELENQELQTMKSQQEALKNYMSPSAMHLAV